MLSRVSRKIGIWNWQDLGKRFFGSIYHLTKHHHHGKPHVTRLLFFALNIHQIFAHQIPELLSNVPNFLFYAKIQENSFDFFEKSDIIGDDKWISAPEISRKTVMRRFRETLFRSFHNII